MKLFYFFLIPLFLLGACSKKNESKETTTTNLSSTVVSNLSTVSAGFSPTSLASSSTSSVVQPQSEVCSDSDGFAVCQSNLIREYLKIGKEMVDLLSTITGSIGTSLGNLPDGASGTSSDGAIQYSKVSSSVWSVLAKGASGASQAYFSINESVYTLKLDNSVAASNPTALQAEATVNYTDANNWSVDVFFSNTDCNSADVGQPSKASIKITKANGLWTGKAMLYQPRWEAPGQTLTCSTAAGTSEITMFTDFIGNDTSTKAALYLIPATVSDLSGSLPASTIGSYDLMDFCANFSSSCGGSGQPTTGFLAAYPNNWCTTGPGAAPNWGNNCTDNAPVAAAAFGASADWIVPSVLKTKSVTLPTNL